MRYVGSCEVVRGYGCSVVAVVVVIVTATAAVLAAAAAARTVAVLAVRTLALGTAQATLHVLVVPELPACIM